MMLPCASIRFVRIKQVDKRGEFEFSFNSSEVFVSFKKISYKIKLTIKHQKELHMLCFVILKTLCRFYGVYGHSLVPVI